MKHKLLLLCTLFCSVLSAGNVQPLTLGTFEESDSKLELRAVHEDYFYYNGILVNITDIRQNEVFYVDLGYLTCTSEATFQGDVQLALCNKDGNFKQDVFQEKLEIFSIPKDGSWKNSKIPCLISQTIEDGDYLVVRYRHYYTETWKVASGDVGVIDKVVIKEANTPYTGTLSLLGNNYGNGIFPGATNTYTQDYPFIITLENIINDSEQIFTGYITLSVFDKDHQWKEDVLDTPLILHGFEKDNIHFFKEIKCIIKNPVIEGDYLVVQYKHKNSTEWTRMYSKNGALDKIVLKTNEAGEEGMIYLAPGTFENESYNGLETGNKTFKLYQKFDVKCGLYYTAPGKSFNGTTSLHHFDKDGNSKGIISNYGISLIGEGTMGGIGYHFECEINRNIEEGDYIALAYQHSGNPNWIKVSGKDGAIDQIPIILDESTEDEENNTEEKEIFYLSSGESGNKYYNGLSVTNDSILIDTGFEVEMGLLNHVEGIAFNGCIAICHFDKDGKWKEKICDDNQNLYIETKSELAVDELPVTFLCIVRESIEEGDYIAMAYRHINQSKWREISGKEGVVSRIKIYPREVGAKRIARYTQFTYNPKNKTFSIKTLLGTTYKFCDASGNTLTSGTLSGKDSFSIDTSGLSAGIYHLTIADQAGQIETAINIKQQPQK